MERKPKFALGRVVTTQNAQASLEHEDIVAALGRHETGDWGEVSTDDLAEGGAMTKEIRPLTRELYDYLVLDIWPSPETCQDFGIETTKHLRALQWAARMDDVTLEQFEEALGYGEKLNALISRTNPYLDVSFHTAWDEIRLMGDEPEETDDDTD